MAKRVKKKPAKKRGPQKRKLPKSTEGVPRGYEVQVQRTPGGQFAKGNNMWERRSKHGADVLFGSPELLWQAACEYFQWCVENPWVKWEVRQSGIIGVPTARPFSLHGLCIHIGCSTGYFKEFKRSRAEKTDFISVITRIEEVVYSQKFEGAAVGAFNANIISRDLGLQDKIAVEVDAPKPENEGPDGDALRESVMKRMKEIDEGKGHE